MPERESKIEEVKRVRKAILDDLKGADVRDSEDRGLPELTQYLAKQSVISMLPTDRQIDEVKGTEHLDKQLSQMNNLRNSRGNLSITENDLANRFLFTGTTYKGQAQSGYSILGGGLKAKASIDPGKVLGLGLLSTEIDVSAGAKRAKQLLIVVQAHPFKVSDTLTTDRPITLHPMYGVMWEATLGASLFIGIEAKNPLDSSVDVSGITGLDEEDSLLAPALALEVASFDMGAKAGFEAEVDYVYHNVLLLDDTPTYYTQEISVVREGLKPLFKFAEDEDTVKEHAIEFQNKNKEYFTNEEKNVTILGFSRWASTVAEWLNQGLDNPDTPADIKEEAKQHLSLLKPFYDSIPQDTDSFLALSSHSPSGKAGFFAEAEVGGSILVGLVAAEVKARLDALKIAGMYKKAYLRYQSRTPLGTASQPVLYTQDTTITYGQVDFTPIALEASASAEALGRTIAGWRLDECLAGYDIPAPEVKYVLHNSMTYDAVSMYWQKPELSSDVSTLTLLSGSGVSFGSSVSILNLENLADESWEDEKTPKLAEKLAKRLHVSTENIREFITKLNTAFGGLKKYLEDLRMANGLSVVLVEANFDVAGQTVDLVSADDSVGVNKASAQALMSTFVSNQAGDPQKPQAMRLRYRLADKINSDSTAFKLGFKIFGTGVGIEINEVDRVGAEGVADLATIWFNEELATLSATNPDAAHEDKISVPPVTLFCQ